MKTHFNKIDNDWLNVKNKCRTTDNKEPSAKPPDSDFKTRLLIAEHSPIRLIKVDWLWANIKSWCATHWSRHKWECFISTRRSDRIGENRDELPQGELVNFEGEANAQHLIDTWRKRLCYNASPETRELAEDFKAFLIQFEPELADVLVPNCIYRCGCPEMKSCGFFDKFLESLSTEELIEIKTRYAVYNNQFYNK